MCCSGFLKIMMFIFNGAIFVAGGAILGVGVWFQVDSSSVLGFTEEVRDASAEIAQLINVSYLLIAVGAVLLIIGFLGCCGAVMKNRCMLLTFFIIVLIIFIVQVAGAIVLFVFTDVAEEPLGDLEQEVRENIENRYGIEDSSVTHFWDTTMEGLQCCGFNNYTDFDGSPFHNNSRGLYPPQCCNSNVTVCSSSEAQSSNISGCFIMLVKLIEDNALIIAAVAIGIAAIEIAAMVVSMILYKKAGKKGRLA
ncbi:tetraspanin 34a isoform X1 [Acanthochromis polyacanthus]|uniref:tetraspanin 34a isoform X1 n=1 Tax=Acanthochromis polyacanthus TaxID=80966 RepID=UPI002233E594|nr:tetraspanin 34a isoform X1 [Acanthochromis polyacanthus]